LGLSNPGLVENIAKGTSRLSEGLLCCPCPSYCYMHAFHIKVTSDTVVQM